jgi:hypothetical protein
MTRARTAHCADHARHVGVCPACQRARLEAEKRQLAEVREVLDTDGQRERTVARPPEPDQADHGSARAGLHGFTSTF